MKSIEKKFLELTENDNVDIIPPTIQRNYFPAANVAGTCYARLADDREVWEKLAAVEMNAPNGFEIWWETCFTLAKIETQVRQLERIEQEISDHIAGRDRILWDVEDADNEIEDFPDYTDPVPERLRQGRKHSGKMGRYIWDKNGLYRKTPHPQKRVRNNADIAGKNAGYKKA